MIRNPILPGFHPDPSVCRVGQDVYLVTSSFSYFPGIPVFHSRDLSCWTQIGHVIDRPNMLQLHGRHLSGGLWAPTIRYHDGLFYVICTHSEEKQDFVCTAEDPSGPWSDPHWIEGAPGIDPSLFWDDDGQCYMVGNDWSIGYCRIWGARFDERAFSLLEPPVELWRGALHDCHAPEAPHMYKRDGRYYLLIAEGGTGINHAVTVAASDRPLGRYRGYPGNPILTHRHLGQRSDITCTGHGDLLEMEDHRWYMVLLGCRPTQGRTMLGRETFLAEVAWENGWPVVNPGIGRVTWEVPSPVGRPEDGGGMHVPEHLVWNRPGTRSEEAVRRDGDDILIRCVRAPMLPDGDLDEPIGFTGRRVEHGTFVFRAMVTLPTAEASAGIMILQNRFHALRLELVQEEGKVFVRCVKTWHEDGAMHAETLFEEETGRRSAVLEIFSHGAAMPFMFTMSVDGNAVCLADGWHLSVEEAGGFIGAYAGLFASGNGREIGHEARFSGMLYEGK
ncbi:MAG: family 43 glycosylhydrolase [Clostridia bacterium]|nr:family 43 glycosylhydrolase [Clostridia bacterium]